MRTFVLTCLLLTMIGGRTAFGETVSRQAFREKAKLIATEKFKQQLNDMPEKSRPSDSADRLNASLALYVEPIQSLTDAELTLKMLDIYGQSIRLDNFNPFTYRTAAELGEAIKRQMNVANESIKLIQSKDIDIQKVAQNVDDLISKLKPRIYSLMGSYENISIRTNALSAGDRDFLKTHPQEARSKILKFTITKFKSRFNSWLQANTSGYRNLFVAGIMSSKFSALNHQSLQGEVVAAIKERFEKTIKSPVGIDLSDPEWAGLDAATVIAARLYEATPSMEKYSRTISFDQVAKEYVTIPNDLKAWEGE